MKPRLWKGYSWVLARSRAVWPDGDMGGTYVSHVVEHFIIATLKKRDKINLKHTFYLTQYTPNIIISTCN